MLKLEGITLAFGARLALDDVWLDVRQGDILCLLGESGCGKTTLLRVVAGLAHPQAGVVKLAGVDVSHQPTEKRDVGLMFQDYALFPHLSVLENVAFGLKVRGVPTAERTKQARAMLVQVGLDEQEGRNVAELSGGQKQRVALARSLILRPRLLMLDEPLGSLDAGLRAHLSAELKQTIKAHGLTAVYVTHDQAEAYAIADVVAIMRGGRIEQVDTPQSLYCHPKTRYVAQFLGLHNVIEVYAWRDGIGETALGRLPMPFAGRWACIHPDAIALTAQHGLPAQITNSIFSGDRYLLQARAGEVTLHFSQTSWGDVPEVGERVSLMLREGGIIPLDE
jgi:ABC-type Fe3+/spermidine/putrescine transport system ATPase subunit